MPEGLEKLRPEHSALLARWVPDAELASDHSWGLTDTVVLELTRDQGRLILKAGGPQNRDIRRELRAHRQWLGPWNSIGRAPRLVHGDTSAGMLITEYLPGHLIEGSQAQSNPDAFRQAGELLADFHGQLSTFDHEWHDRSRARVEQHLARPHRIDPDLEQRVRSEISQWPSGGAEVVPTHGDWQPRNWLTDEGIVRVIDFGRAELRPPSEDFVRLARQDFARDPKLESAFLDGYGRDPRDGAQWRRSLIGEAVGTAVWAHRVGNEEFEAFGHELLRSLYPPVSSNQHK